MKKLPIGVSTFERIISDGALYVDKTKILYELIKSTIPKRYFFSRPRRFGKSLTCSTLRAIFEGRKELFDHLWIGQSDYTWEKRPVIFLDFSQIRHQSCEDLVIGLHNTLEEHAKQYNIILTKTELKSKLVELIENLGQTIAPVAVIIDEYDKPITDLMYNLELAQESSKELRHFYATFKGYSIDANMHFLFITGVSKFAGTPLFYDQNSFDDLTDDYRTDDLGV